MTDAETGPLIETGYAKINLALHVRHRAADGYHAIETIFAFAEDGDRLILNDGEGVSLAIEGPFAAGLAGESDNLVTRAADRFLARFGGGGAAFTLEKTLPVASGIGGGSADAAAALRLLCRRGGVAVAEVMDIAAGLGADVPACIASVAQRGTGRGDELMSIAGDTLGGLALLLVNPLKPVSTGAVFKGWDQVDRGALGEGDPLAVALAGRNDLEPPALAIEPEIARVLALLGGQEGVTLARMSGSGATCFALFDGTEARNAAAEAIGVAEPGWWLMASRLR